MVCIVTRVALRRTKSDENTRKTMTKMRKIMQCTKIRRFWLLDSYNLLVRQQKHAGHVMTMKLLADSNTAIPFGINSATADGWRPIVRKVRSNQNKNVLCAHLLIFCFWLVFFYFNFYGLIGGLFHLFRRNWTANDGVMLTLRQYAIDWAHTSIFSCARSSKVILARNDLHRFVVKTITINLI